MSKNRSILTKQDKIRLVKEFRSSGLSISAFSKAKNIAASTFFGWKRQYCPDSIKKMANKARAPKAVIEPSPSFASVVLVDPPPTSGRTVNAASRLDSPAALAMEITLPSGVIIRLGENCPSQAFVATALAALEVR